MPLQPDLLGPPSLTVQPIVGQSGPRLWVKRLAIWEEPGGEKVRDISFRPGLNIIWSPDGGDALSSESPTDAIGHGSGKTLFCRLLRYCLGEDRYAADDQRERVGVAFLNGIVGAEVMLDGVCWAILRPLGVRRRHMAVAGGNLDEIAAGEGTSTGLEPFLDAVESTILTTGLAALIFGQRSDRRSWPIALAWLTRDQECRFNDVLEWRSTASDSDSPARGMTQTEKLDALRAFIVAITPEEHAKRAEVANLDDQRRALEQEIGHRRWEIDRTQSRLAGALGASAETLADGPLAVEQMRKAAQDRLASAAKLPAGQPRSDIDAAGREHEGARAEWTRLEAERIRIEATIPESEKMASQLQGELPGISFSKSEAESPICPICDVPIDRALAEGCGVSHKLPDLEACRQRLALRKKNIEDEINRLAGLRSARTQTHQQLALAKQGLDQLAESLAAIEKARDAREGAWYAARRLVDDVERLSELIGTQETARKSAREIVSRLETERAVLGAFRDKQARVFGRLTEKFDPIVRRLVGSDVKGRVTLSGNGLEPNVNMGGDRTTAAIDSLKVLAFDLAVLCLSIEGATRVPAFLIHDSPREADLGLSIYHRLFRLVTEIEGAGGLPQFQYIVTTTTRPPGNLAVEPWLRLTLRGSPSTERLLRRDL
ncbi:chromosome segregation protein SMC [Acidisoma sp. S159]|uniref:chromosome segregation protein SMC n=1 Tax=Acidisoma sp. S159 TaxID=1747225 RepID=UPI001C204D5C|nr:chromosome segregation protein SMC [Acidisoma sp. S159]